LLELASETPPARTLRYKPVGMFCGSGSVKYVRIRGWLLAE
jgi:hypothetical protein